MCARNYRDGSHTYATSQGHALNPAYELASGHTSGSLYALDSGNATASSSVTVPTSAQSRIRAHSRPSTPTVPVLNPVQVPLECYPIELAQFARPSFPLHWAIFVRAALATSSHAPGSAHARARCTPTPVTRGHFYELVGTSATFTAQLMPDAPFAPETLSDWRGTHVIGWVSPGQLHVFEKVVRQVQVWRHRPDWRCHEWVYDVVRAVGGNYQGMFMADDVALGGLQKHMERLLEAWESGDI